MNETSHAWNTIAIIESLRPGDRRTGRLLLESVSDRIRGTGANAAVRCYEVRHSSEFLTLLGDLAMEAQSGWLRPIVHLECHGSPEGVELTSGEVVGWESLRAPLSELNRATGFNLLITSGACFGNHLLKLMLNPWAPAPAWGVVGSSGEVSEHAVELGYQEFYARVLELGGGAQLMEGLNRSVGDEDSPFVFFSAGFAFRWAFVLTQLKEILDEKDPGLIWSAFDEVSGRKGPSASVEGAKLAANIRKRDPTLESEITAQVASYFMFDAIPENISRFGVSLEDLVSLTALNTALAP